MREAGTETTSGADIVRRALEDEALLAQLFPGSHERRHAAGEALFLEGDPPTHIHVVRKGVAKIVGRLAPTERDVILGLVAAPGTVGGMSITTGGPRETSVFAITDMVTLAVPRIAVVELAHAQPAFAMGLLDISLEWMREVHARLLEVSTLDVLTRLSRRLVELHDATGSSESVPLSQAELADLVGASREAVVLALRRLRELGWVATGRRSIQVLDAAALRAQIL